jgi:hypothetical protein
MLNNKGNPLTLLSLPPPTSLPQKPPKGRKMGKPKFLLLVNDLLLSF